MANNLTRTWRKENVSVSGRNDDPERAKWKPKYLPLPPPKPTPTRPHTPHDSDILSAIYCFIVLEQRLRFYSFVVIYFFRFSVIVKKEI